MRLKEDGCESNHAPARELLYMAAREENCKNGYDEIAC
jgi:hypothetical protein